MDWIDEDTMSTGYLDTSIETLNRCWIALSTDLARTISIGFIHCICKILPVLGAVQRAYGVLLVPQNSFAACFFITVLSRWYQCIREPAKKNRITALDEQHLPQAATCCSLFALIICL